MKFIVTLGISLLSIVPLFAQDHKHDLGIQIGQHQYTGSKGLSDTSWSPIPDKWGTNILVNWHNQISRRIGFCAEIGYYQNELDTAAVNRAGSSIFKNTGYYRDKEKSYISARMFTVLIGPSFSVGNRLMLFVIPYVGWCFQQEAKYEVDYYSPSQNETYTFSFVKGSQTKFIFQPTFKLAYDISDRWRVTGAYSLTMLNNSSGTYYFGGMSFAFINLFSWGTYHSPAGANYYPDANYTAFNLGLAYKL